MAAVLASSSTATTHLLLVDDGQSLNLLEIGDLPNCSTTRITTSEVISA
jgi:hypothetical protein